jgi:hypothetical protein
LASRQTFDKSNLFPPAPFGLRDSLEVRRGAAAALGQGWVALGDPAVSLGQYLIGPDRPVESPQRLSEAAHGAAKMQRACPDGMSNAMHPRNISLTGDSGWTSPSLKTGATR